LRINPFQYTNLVASPFTILPILVTLIQLSTTSLHSCHFQEDVILAGGATHPVEPQWRNLAFSVAPIGAAAVYALVKRRNRGLFAPV
jgi:hypothetical protein